MPNHGSALQVTLAGRVVAHLEYRHAHSRLVWQDGYWEDPDRPVLGLWFENDPGQRIGGAARLPFWFSNLLPEGRLRTLIASDVGVGVDQEGELLARIGHDLPGAIQITRVTEWDSVWQPEGEPSPTTSHSAEGSALRFSLAGVALKFSLLRDSDRLTVPARDERGDWIVKTPDATFPHVPANEFAMMTLAKLAGITVAAVELVHRDQLPSLPGSSWPSTSESFAYAIERFDRSEGVAVHIEDLAQARGYYPEQKYDGSYQTVANLISRRHDAVSLLEFIRRLAFSVAIGNADLHLKNLSLIYRDGRHAALGPAYDLVSTLGYLPAEHDLALSLGGARHSKELVPESFSRLAEKAHPDTQIGAMALDVVATLAADLSRHWPEVASLMDDLPNHRDLLNKRLNRFTRQFG